MSSTSTTCRRALPADVARAQARLPGASRGCWSVAFGLSLLAALPDALLALWLKLLADGVLDRRPARSCMAAAIGLGVSATADLVPARRQRPHAAPLPRPGDHRARVARRPAAGVGRRPSSTRSGPSTSTGSRCCATRCSCSTTCTCRCSRPCGWILRLGVTVVLLMSIHPALVLLAVFALPTVLTSTWRPGVERAGRGARRAGQPAGPPPVRDGHHRPARQGGARHAASAIALVDRAPRRVGALVRARSRRGALGERAVAHAGVGGLRRRLSSAPSCSSPSGLDAPRRATCCWCWRRARGCRPTSARRSARSASCAASGSTARSGWPGSRTTPPPLTEHADAAGAGSARARASASSTCRSPIPAPIARVLDDVSLRSAGRLGRRDRRRERRRQDARS